MVPSKSQDNLVRVIAALLRSVQTLHSEVFSPRACRLTINKIAKRSAREGQGFLTKTLPRIGKAFDKAFQTGYLESVPNERKLKGSQLPKLFGELFSQVFDNNGRMLPTPCVACISSLRDILYLFYKYESPYSPDQTESVLQKFITTEDEVRMQNERFEKISKELNTSSRFYSPLLGTEQSRVVRRARILLYRLLARFDSKDIIPRHGPGAVSTKERLWGKYHWSNIPDRVVAQFPLDQYFYTSLGHVCDRLQEIQSLGSEEHPAKVILVPKDSRGPRLISCEPLYLQWIQQGISRALVQHVERHPFTKGRVNFTDQTINQKLALIGSISGRFATLDLNEASDRVSLGLIRLLFPAHLVDVLEATRSQVTQMPDGTNVALSKFAPMGSALCFPILALTTWAILAASASDADVRKNIFVYGDDVIVPTEFSANAIEQLEYFGLKVNVDKSYTKGFFRESCGVDAFLGHNVTPIRIRTPWSSQPRPDVYTSWISYANSFWSKRYYQAYDEVVSMLGYIYPSIPAKSMNLSCPSLLGEPVLHRPIRTRINKSLQKREYRVPVVESRTLRKDIDGWMMLLRFFTEGRRKHQLLPGASETTQMQRAVLPLNQEEPFTVSSYTKRGTSKLVFRWR